MTMMDKEKKIIVVTFAIVTLGILLLKILTLSCMRNRAFIESKKSRKVVVLIPPPQEPGDAPMNISMMKKSKVELRNELISTVLNPAVRVVTDWKTETNIILSDPFLITNLTSLNFIFTKFVRLKPTEKANEILTKNGLSIPYLVTGKSFLGVLLFENDDSWKMHCFAKDKKLTLKKKEKIIFSEWEIEAGSIELVNLH